MTRRWQLAVLVVAIEAVSAGHSRGAEGGFRSAPSGTGSVAGIPSKIRIVPGLAEPLVTTKPTTAAEDEAARQAAVAVAAFIPRGDPAGDDTITSMLPLERFVAAFPHSGWAASAHANLGFAYYRGGYFSRALTEFRLAWTEGREATDRRAKSIVDRAVGELAKMQARLGHAAEAEALLAALAGRQLSASATEPVTAAREGAWTERHRPGIAFLCGPKALHNLLEVLGADKDAFDVVDAARSGDHGFTLAQVGELASRAGLEHRLIYRAPGQPVPVPSIVNWKPNHYAAITRREGGRFHVKDPTFDSGTELALAERAIDEEGSGFFLVPASVAQAGGWRTATPREARTIYGMGSTAASDPGHETPSDTTSGGCSGSGGSASYPPAPSAPAAVGGPDDSNHMCAARAHTMEVSLNLNDTPVGYAPPVGPPVFIRITYNQREAAQPAVFTYFNVSAKWTLNFSSYVQDDLTSGLGLNVTRYVNGGGYVAYAGYSSTSGAFAREVQTGAVLTRTPATGAATSYTLTALDGSQLVYGQADGATSGVRRVFLSKIVDHNGNALTLTYGAVPRSAAPTPAPDGGVVACAGGVCPVLTSITDAAGLLTTFTYGDPADPLLITAVTDPFGRSATFGYDPQGRLHTSTDTLGITSTYDYDDAPGGDPGFVTTLTTPYGVSRFNEFHSGTDACTGTNRCLELTDALGHTERVEYRDGVSTVAATDKVVPTAAGFGTWNQYLNYRSSYYWDKNSYPQFGTGATKDYNQAVHYHFLHTADQQRTAWGLETIQRPLESRVWYMHQGQTPSGSSPAIESTLDAVTAQARVLDDGTTQISTFTNNALGAPTQVTDPLGRQTQFTYATNNVDVLTAQQKTSATALVTLGSWTYDSRHNPLTYTDSSGQIARYGYNSAGQLQTVTNTLGDTQTITYDALGRVSVLLDAKNLPVLALTYDALNRVATRTDAASVNLTYAYDAFDRVTTVTYPDGTTLIYGYTNLDLTSVTDRLGRVTSYGYDANRRLIAVTDPLLGVTQYAYYADGTLESITDPNGNVTSQDVDLQHRPTVKHYADGTTESCAYDSAGRVKARTDALGQVTTFTYNVDNTLAGVTYTGSPSTVPLTPTVTFTYDPFFSRRSSMTDGLGTTVYTYYPITAVPALGAGRLQSVTSPVAGALGVMDTVSFSYDPLGRIVTTTVDGVPQGVAYDPLGRLQTVTNALDAFTYAYSDESPRPSSVTSTHGPKLALSYYDPALNPEQAGLVKQMAYTTVGGGLLSSYGYTYYPNGNVQTFVESRPGSFALPPAVQASARGTSGPADRSVRFASAGPAGWLRGSATLVIGSVLLLVGLTWTMRRRRLSRLSLVGLAALALTCGHGSNGSGQVTLYQYDATDKLVSATVASGATPPAPAAPPQLTYGYDPASNPISITAGGTVRPLAYTGTNELIGATYDLDGNPKTMNEGQYTWDAANRLTSATLAGVESDFTYDGLSRLVRIVSKQSGVVTSDRAYAWSGRKRLLERDNLAAGSPVTKQYLAQGVVTAGTGQYYTLDERGSVRQLVDASGAIRAQYSYDPYGNQTKLGGTADSDVGYAGYFSHAASGLALAVYRAYDPQHARWMNRDPIREAGGLNLYAYVGGNPMTRADPLGLSWYSSLVDSFIDALPESVVDSIAGGQGFLDAYQGAVEGLDPTPLTAWLYSYFGLGQNRCSDNFHEGYEAGELSREAYEFGSGLAELRLGYQAIEAESRISALVFKNGRWYGGQRGAVAASKVDKWTDELNEGIGSLFHQTADRIFDLEKSAADASKPGCPCKGH